jgi:mRNA-degrading endonuclease RelE of RelBE toxin-antitoxin system
MAFQVIWSNRSKKDLKLLDKKIASRITGKVDLLVSQETIFLEKVKGTDYFKYRVGHYRILIEKFPATKKLFIRKVRHRKKFYKNV